METGKIKTLTDKGFGFISRVGAEKDLFFHMSNLDGVRYDELKVGDDVEFALEIGAKGPFAVGVRLLA